MYDIQTQNIIMTVIVKAVIVPPFDRKFILNFSFPHRQKFNGKGNKNKSLEEWTEHSELVK